MEEGGGMEGRDRRSSRWTLRSLFFVYVCVVNRGGKGLVFHVSRFGGEGGR